MAMPDIERYGRPGIADVLARAGMDTSAPPWRDAPSGWRRGPCAVCRSGNQRAFAYREDSGRWRCFECDSGGNAWDLVMALEGCTFEGAIALWRNPAESPEPADDDLIGHDPNMPAGPPCPACEAMYRAGMDVGAMIAAHQQTQAVGHA